MKDEMRDQRRSDGNIGEPKIKFIAGKSRQGGKMIRIKGMTASIRILARASHPILMSQIMSSVRTMMA